MNEEDQPEFEVDQKLSESQNFTPYKDLQGYHNFKGTSLVWLFKYTGSKASSKGKKLGGTVTKIQLISRKSIVTWELFDFVFDAFFRIQGHITSD